MKKILIVEDNQEIREMYGLKLRNGGYEVIEAEDGETGLQLLAKEDPDLLLLDIMLPKMDGYDILKEIKEGKARNLPVIVLSNLSSKEDFIEAKELGATDYFVKARSTPADILEKINSFFGSESEK